MINSILVSIQKPMDSWKTGVLSFPFGPLFSIAVWLVREIALTFWCCNYLHLNVFLLKGVQAAVPVMGFDFLKFFFPRGSGHNTSYLVVSGCHDLYSTALQRRAQLDQFWPDSHVWHQRGEVRRLGSWLLPVSSVWYLSTRSVATLGPGEESWGGSCCLFLIFLQCVSGQVPTMPCCPCSEEGEKANTWPFAS